MYMNKYMYVYIPHMSASWYELQNSDKLHSRMDQQWDPTCRFDARLI